MNKQDLNNQTPKFLRPKPMASHIGVALSTLWNYQKQGRIQSIKVSERVTLFNVADVEKALLGEVA
jgi:predicted site-specific integrase-resolvase